MIYEFFNEIRFYSLSVPTISTHIRTDEGYNPINKFIWPILLRIAYYGFLGLSRNWR